MSVSKDKTTGKWYAVVKVKNKDGTVRWKKKRGFETKREAKKWEVRITDEIAQSADDLPTFREVAEMRHKADQLLPPTIMQCEFAYSMFGFMDTAINRITREDMMKWRLSLSEKGYSTGTTTQIIAKIKAVFRFAESVYDYRSPANVLKPFKKTQEEANKEMDVWTVEEFDTFLSAVESPLLKVMYEFIFWTGCRKGEAIAMKKSKITPDRMCVFDETLSNRAIKESAIKNKHVRKIKLDPSLYAKIEPLLSEPGPYLFGGEAPVPADAIGYQKDVAVKKSGVKRIRLHDFRHSHVSILYAAGVPTKAIAERIGDTEETVLKVYKHLMQSTVDQMNKTIENLHKS